ncbi:DUF3179 domain-containing protein [Haloquadratum walsbyi]|jgi:hypothetical protein|uniref:DUF3179 domain-containing protein n=1 Tax=Haloquadratum walsbyi TaxID=293091 RepID=UPI0015F4027F|nr:DUF3179 domain-containing protein [Haloquadratum walsbyi]
MPARRHFLASVGTTTVAALTAGCSGRINESESDTTEQASQQSTTVSPTETGASIPTRENTLPLPLSPSALREAAQSGGPEKDGIPSIDNPTFVSSDKTEILDPGDPVLGVVHNGITKAYPQAILVLHEIVNDTFGDENITVTYCPLTGTAQGFDRGETTFGVSGRLINNNLVMYDRATETWWPQMLATAIPGPWNESPTIHSLTPIRVTWTTWKQWKQRHPDTRVLSTQTGYAKNYGRDPYGSYNPLRGYYADERLLFPALHQDDRYPKKTIVHGARTPEGAAAFHKESLRQAGVLSGTIDELSVIAVYDPELDTGYVYENPEEMTVTRDQEQGQVIAPDGSRHDPSSLPLTRVYSFDAMWFAWAGYYPETAVYAND